jgi:phosphatidylserine/phosphatidylglycerophosphate/cardiolipin synthase-like enzyme
VVVSFGQSSGRPCDRPDDTEAKRRPFPATYRGLTWRLTHRQRCFYGISGVEIGSDARREDALRSLRELRAARGAVAVRLAVLPEAGAEPFVTALESATKSIRVMVYQMGFGPILDTLEAKARAGVSVRVILDVAQIDTNQKYMDRLKAAGAEVIWSDSSFAYMHAKVIIADGKKAVISTGNYSASYMAKERNYVVTNTDPADLQVLTALFEADFARTSPNLSCTRLLVSPVNARARLLELIASAKQTLLVESMQLGDRDVRDAIAARKAEGVDVRVILADPNWIDANAGAGKFLAANSIPARSMKAPAVHVKAIVADDRAYVGSENLSYTSLSKNREVGLIVTEPANVETITTTFETDWATATEF